MYDEPIKALWRLRDKYENAEHEICGNAADAIESLTHQLADMTALRDEYEQKWYTSNKNYNIMTAERDAAVADLRETSDTYRICAACKHIGDNGGCKESNPKKLCGHNGTSKWQWRGVQVADHVLDTTKKENADNA
jgi:hypothetical protein